MTQETEFKPRVPSLRELIRWHNQFGRMLEPNERRTKLFGVDGKEVKFIERSKPDYFWIYKNTTDLDKNYFDDPRGYCQVQRADGSESDFRLACPDGREGWLTYAECDLVLGSNYYVIDRSYSSPSPLIRKILFKADENRADDYNAFELGDIRGLIGEGYLTTVIYYKIPQQRFRELRDWNTNLDSLVEQLKNKSS